MAARFDWAVPTVLGNNDEPTLAGDSATKNYVDQKLGNVTISDNIIQGTGAQDGTNGLYLAPGVDSVAQQQYLQVRGGDVATHIHLDTGDNQYFDQYFGDDNKFVKLANTGNIVINSNDVSGNSAQWTFDTKGNLTLPTNVSSINYANGSPYGGGGSSITNGSTSVVANPTNVKISANAANNFQFGTDPYGTVLSLNPSNSPVQNIRAINQVNGIAVNEGALFTFDGIFPYDGPEKLGNATMPWNSVTAYGFESLGNITTGGFVADSSNITTANIVTLTSNTATITTLTTTTLNANGGNISANTFTANSVTTNKVYQTNVLGRYTCNEITVGATSAAVIPWTASGTLSIPDLGFITVGPEPTGGIRNNSATDTLVVAVSGSITWNTNTNTGGTRILFVYLNDVAQIAEQDNVISGSTWCAQSFYYVLAIPPGQYFSVQVQNTSAGSATVGGTVPQVLTAPTNKLIVQLLYRLRA